MNETRLDIFNGAFFGILFFQLIEPLTAPGHWLASFPYAQSSSAPSGDG